MSWITQKLLGNRADFHQWTTEPAACIKKQSKKRFHPFSYGTFCTKTHQHCLQPTCLYNVHVYITIVNESSIPLPIVTGPLYTVFRHVLHCLSIEMDGILSVSCSFLSIVLCRFLSQSHWTDLFVGTKTARRHVTSSLAHQLSAFGSVWKYRLYPCFTYVSQVWRFQIHYILQHVIVYGHLRSVQVRAQVWAQAIGHLRPSPVALNGALYRYIPVYYTVGLYSSVLQKQSILCTFWSRRGTVHQPSLFRTTLNPNVLQGGTWYAI